MFPFLVGAMLSPQQRREHVPFDMLTRLRRESMPPDANPRCTPRPLSPLASRLSPLASRSSPLAPRSSLLAPQKKTATVDHSTAAAAFQIVFDRKAYGLSTSRPPRVIKWRYT